AGRDVGDRAPGLGGSLGRAGGRHEARLALDQQVVGLLVAVGTVGTVAGNVADDQPRVFRVQRVEGQAHARGRAGRQVLHQYVGALEQLREDAGGLRVLQVER